MLRRRLCHTYGGYLSKISAAREPSAIRSIQPLLSVPGMISLGGGLPNPETFPFTGLTVSLSDGSTMDLSDELPAALQYSGTGGISSLVDALTAIQEKEHAVSFSKDR